LLASYVNDCRHGNITKLAGGTPGYLALFASYPPPHPLTAGQSVRHRSCPWVITVDPGREIHVSWKIVPPEDTGSRMDGGSCPVQLSFRDGDEELTSSAACRAFPDSVPGFVYASKTHRLEIKVADTILSTGFDRTDSWKPYILQYQGILVTNLFEISNILNEVRFMD